MLLVGTTALLRKKAAVAKAAAADVQGDMLGVSAKNGAYASERA